VLFVLETKEYRLEKNFPDSSPQSGFSPLVWGDMPNQVQK
jgi:hypothetical protein